MRNIVVIGNCHGRKIADRLKRAYAGIEDVSVAAIESYREITPDLVEQINSAWMVCAQMGDFRQKELDNVHLGERPIVYFPVMSLSAIWPAATKPHPNDAPTAEFPSGIFPGSQFGDEKANELIRRGLPPQQAFEEYMALDFAKVFRLDRLLEMNKAKLLNLGAKCDFPAWGVYEGSLSSTRLHHTNLHPSNFVLDALTWHLVERIGLPTADWKMDRESFHDQNQMPIHPDVVKSFGLTWYDDRSRFYFEGDITHAEYMRRYFNLQANAALQAGVKLSIQGKREQAADKLREGLEDSPDGHYGWFVLGKVLRALNRWHEALDAFRRAASLQPSNGEYAAAAEKAGATLARG